MPTIPNRAQRQALELQQIAFTTANTLLADLQSSQDKHLRTTISKGIAQVVKAWDTMEERKRILKGKPMPGSLRPERKPKKQMRAFSHATEPQEALPPPEQMKSQKESLSPSETPRPPAGEGGE